MEKKEMISKIKDDWRKAKIMCGDHRGMDKNRFSVAARHGIPQMKVYYDSATVGGDTRNECFAEINEIPAYSLKDLLKELDWFIEQGTKEIEISFRVNVWNKKRTEADPKNLFISQYSFS